MAPWLPEMWGAYMTSRAPQIVFEWNGEVMRPLAFHRDLCARTFEPGKRYKLIEFSERSRETHDHLFTTIRGYWRNWPEKYPRELPSEDTLRKHALIQTGHYIQSLMAHDSIDSATAYIRDFIRYIDYCEGSIVSTESGTATVMRIAKTLKKSVMGAAEFQKAKTDILDFCQSVTGIAPEQMEREAKKGAAA
jgi:hypothetical protein